jgi:predicted nucleic acid-binding protein
MDDISDCELVNKDLLIDQLKDHIREMEKNEEIFERLNKKFVNLQNE